MNDHDHARMLLDMARKDLVAAKAMNDPEVFSDEIVGFHVQQAIEKSLKAWLADSGEDYPMTHDISLLLYRIEEQDVISGQFDHLIEYNIFAVQYRYETYHQTADPLDRSEACRQAEELVGHVAAIISA